jgi:hypothetical protein
VNHCIRCGRDSNQTMAIVCMDCLKRTQDIEAELVERKKNVTYMPPRMEQAEAMMELRESGPSVPCGTLKLESAKLIHATGCTIHIHSPEDDELKDAVKAFGEAQTQASISAELRHDTDGTWRCWNTCYIVGRRRPGKLGVRAQWFRAKSAHEALLAWYRDRKEFCVVNLGKDKPK